MNGTYVHTYVLTVHLCSHSDYQLKGGGQLIGDCSCYRSSISFLGPQKICPNFPGAVCRLAQDLLTGKKLPLAPLSGVRQYVEQPSYGKESERSPQSRYQVRQFVKTPSVVSDLKMETKTPS